MMMEDPGPLSPGKIAQIACLLEATARKPGNVHRFRDFDDVSYLDFVLSASAIAGPLDEAVGTALGLTILRCVEATRRLVGTNTNLGMILLLAPLASVPVEMDMRQGLAQILRLTTVEDASLVYRAIRLAQPGGLGEVDTEDVADEPTISLLEAMKLAADRDLVARQYANGFADVFDSAYPSLKRSIVAGRPIETAIITAFLEFLARNPDTLISRKRGPAVAYSASQRALEVISGDSKNEKAGKKKLAELDEWLRGDGHARNPGATADLTTAALFVALRDGTIQLPITGTWSCPE